MIYAAIEDLHSSQIAAQLIFAGDSGKRDHVPQLLALASRQLPVAPLAQKTVLASIGLGYNAEQSVLA